jgi:hypothetical protein
MPAASISQSLFLLLPENQFPPAVESLYRLQQTNQFQHLQ